MRKIFLLLALPVVFLGSDCLAEDTTIDFLNASWDAEKEAYSITWDSMDSSGTLKYLVYREFGYNVPNPATSDLVGVTGLTNIVDYNANPRYGVYTYLVVSSDTIPSHPQGSNSGTGYFFYGNLRGDADGSQVGFQQYWDCTFKIAGDAEIYAAVYPPGTTYTYDADFIISSLSGMSNQPTKVLHDYVPMSKAINDWENVVRWDSRNSSGTLVSNGIYHLFLHARSVMPDGSTRISGHSFFTIPVDLIRFLSFSIASITAENSQARISYEINASCKVRILICKTGTTFTTASASGSLTYLTSYTYAYNANDPLPVNPDTGSVDGSQILRLLEYYRQSGSHNEEWDGRNQAGAALSNNIYPITVMAEDDYDNQAFGTANNDYYIYDTISVDTTFVDSDATDDDDDGDGGDSGDDDDDISRPIVSAFSPADGATQTAAFSYVTATLYDGLSGSGVDLLSSTISLLDSNGNTIPGTQTSTSVSSSTGTLVYTFANTFTRANNGTYTISVVPVDNNGNGTGGLPITAGFTVDIQDPSVFAAGTEVYAYPNPIKKSAAASFSFSLNRATNIKFEVYNILGEMLFEDEVNYAGGAQTYVWNLKNDDGHSLSSGVYIYKIKGSDGSATQEYKNKIILIQ